MGHPVDIHRIPRAAFSAPLTEGQRSLIGFESLPGEPLGVLLARWIEKDGWVQAQAELLAGSPGARSFDGWDREAHRLHEALGYVAQLSRDPILRFLHHGASRADWNAHLARLPEAARRLASNHDLICLAAEETRALASVERTQWEDDFPHLAAPLADDDIDVFHAYGDGGLVLTDADFSDEYSGAPWPQTVREVRAPVASSEHISPRVIAAVLIGGLALLVFSAWLFGGC